METVAHLLVLAAFLSLRSERRWGPVWAFAVAWTGVLLVFFWHARARLPLGF